MYPTHNYYVNGARNNLCHVEDYAQLSVEENTEGDDNVHTSTDPGKCLGRQERSLPLSEVFSCIN